ncbi:MAG: hypothetical protein QXI27_04365 [Nitrososphaerota archaeon]
MSLDDRVLRHYLREDVQAEISRFCRDRWVAVEGTSRGGRRTFYRYFDEKPITIREPGDIKKIVMRLGRRVLRTIYASANLYRELKDKDDVARLENISMVTPSIDIDCSLGEVELAIEAARTIIEEMSSNGLSESVYLVWSGRGIHLHINEKAVSEAYWTKDPVRVGHVVVEYVLRRCRERLSEICNRSKAMDRRLKIENLMDVQRVFTAPLSIHRELDIVAVTISPEDLESFSIDWARIENYRYWKNWDRYIQGEADKLVSEALGSINIYELERTEISREEPLMARPRSENDSFSRPKIGRFQVMALLQAARYYLIKGDLESAKSFGLNRAIFYAWAKKRGVRPTHRMRTTRPIAKTEAVEKNEVEEVVGDETVYRRIGGWYTIGGEEQRPEDFDRQIASRFGSEKAFEKYWEKAIKYLQSFPRSMIESQKDFFEKIYLPVRDDPEKIIEADKGDSA